MRVGSHTSQPKVTSHHDDGCVPAGHSLMDEFDSPPARALAAALLRAHAAFQVRPRGAVYAARACACACVCVCFQLSRAHAACQVRAWMWVLRVCACVSSKAPRLPPATICYYPCDPVMLGCITCQHNGSSTSQTCSPVPSAAVRGPAGGRSHPLGLLEAWRRRRAPRRRRAGRRGVAWPPAGRRAGLRGFG
jgi:hypothetical protein